MAVVYSAFSVAMHDRRAMMRSAPTGPTVTNELAGSGFVIGLVAGTG